MEKQLAALKLQQSRARLRALLLPDPLTGRIEADVFPRSAAMRLLISALPALAMLATRSRPVRLLAEAFGLRPR